MADMQRKRIKKLRRKVKKLQNMAGPSSIGSALDGLNVNKPKTYAGLEDASVAAQLQNQAALNRMDESNAFGSRDFIRNPDGSISVRDSLAPEEAALLGEERAFEMDATQAARSALAGSGLGQGFDAGLGQRQITEDSFADQRQRYSDQVYDALASDLDKRRAQETQAFEQSLYNRGYRPDQIGQGQWSDMSSDFRDSWQDQYRNARLAGIREGGAEFDRALGAQETVRGNQLNEASISQNQNLSTIGSLFDFGDGVAQPNFASISPVQVGAPDYTGAVQGGVANQLARKKLRQDAALTRAQLAAAYGGRSSGGGGAESAVPDSGYDVI